jgi:hypothetical protein
LFVDAERAFASLRSQNGPPTAPAGKLKDL